MSEANHGDGPPVAVRRDGAVATVVLNRPARRNALSLEMLGALRDALAEVAGDADVRAVVLGAEGPVFSSGHDLREITEGDEAAHRRVFDACAEVMLLIHRTPQPVVARVQGLATA